MEKYKYNYKASVILILFLLSSARHANAFIDPFTTAVSVAAAGAASLFLAGFDLVSCKLRECCNENWIPQNISGIEQALNELVYGQHLASKVLIKHLGGHFRDKDPGKALVLSLHGWTGSGKNHASRLIAEKMFKKGLESQYVHLIPVTLYFKHEDKVNIYKDQLQQWIRGNVSRCARQLFILDEVDKMPSGVLDGLKPFMDHHKQIDGVDYRKSTFLLLSNTGGEAITKFAYRHFLSGLNRDEITFKDIENVLEKDVFNQPGGLLYSDLIRHHLVSAFVPFLPLERPHVERCIDDKLRERNVTVKGEERSRLIARVANELTYFPEDSKLYSTTGCKRIVDKINLILEHN